MTPRRAWFSAVSGSALMNGWTESGKRSEEKKTPAQAGQWGGEADAMLDPNYHTAQDTVANVDRAALALNAEAIGYGIGHYAQSTDGVNGVPPAGDARTAARADVGK